MHRKLAQLLLEDQLALVVVRTQTRVVLGVTHEGVCVLDRFQGAAYGG